MMFPFKLICCGSKRLKFCCNKRVKYLFRKESTFANNYVSSPVYPQILESSPKAKKERERQLVHDKYKDLHTVEEKLFALNLPKYYGWKSLILREGHIPYNFLPFVEYITRTHFVEVNSEMFHRAQNIDPEEIKELIEKIRPQLQDAIIFELTGRRWNHEIVAKDENSSKFAVNNKISTSVIKQINGIILANLSFSHQHLMESVVDYEPRLEAFWAVGGFHPSEQIYEERNKNKNLSEEEKNELVEHWIQYFGNPCIQIRGELPLTELNLEAIEGPVVSQNKFTTGISDPQLSYGLEFERKFGTNIPGFWPGEINEYGILSFHTQGDSFNRFNDDEEQKSALNAHAALASFSWLHAQANYQGFSTFHELTYPLITQTIITDGRQFSFHLYQMNTLLLHSDHPKTNPRINVCVTNPSLPLYQGINKTELFGWNDEVLSKILSCYLNTPKVRVGINLKPYLHSTEQFIADIEPKDRRIWLHKQFRHMYSNRPRDRLPYEIYDWERIYKIKFETRPMDARFRPFELDCNPTEDRKYSDHVPQYIPKKFRSKKKHWTGWRTKFEKTFYPNV